MAAQNTLAVDIGYVNALGRHEIIPIPFNQPRIATPTNPLCGPAAICREPSRFSIGSVLHVWLHCTNPG